MSNSHADSERQLACYRAAMGLLDLASVARDRESPIQAAARVSYEMWDLIAAHEARAVAASEHADTVTVQAEAERILRVLRTGAVAIPLPTAAARETPLPAA